MNNMSNEIKECPNCTAPLKGGLMSSNTLLSQYKIDLINEYNENPSSYYCNKCGNELYKEFKNKLKLDITGIISLLENLIINIPVISTHTPMNWQYRVLDMVTGQSSTGTGVVTEFTSTFTDIFGAQSGMHNQKLKEGENICFAKLRKQTLDLGGNAVIATDIDYSEVGSGRGILMVCMAGTAIVLNNVEILGTERASKIIQIQELNTRLQYLNNFPLVEL